jgi:hypothetical protein
MATTAELIARLQEQYKGWNADGVRGIRTYLDTAHMMLVTALSEQRIYYDTSNGCLPYLTTTAGTYLYTSSNHYSIDNVVVEVNVTGSLLDNISGSDYGFRNGKPRISYVNHAGVDYINIPNVKTTPMTESASASIVFTKDPGDTTDVYQLYGVRAPARITSDSVQIEVPAPWDDMFLVPAVGLLIEGVENGNYLEARMQIYKNIIPAMRKQFNTGAQGFDYEAESRGF